MGTIIKRPVANGAWGKASSPSSYADEYHRRSEIMRRLGPIDGEPDNPHTLTMGFTLANPNVDVAIVGTHNPDHVRSNIELTENRLPISDGVVQELYRRFDQVEDDWRQLT
jgi:aryl-alcohol dehydrogenase-like predicted oxidoreductase